jgi:hypothetical protein
VWLIYVTETRRYCFGQECSLFVYVWKCSVKLYTARKGTKSTKTSDSAPVLQYGSGPSLTSWTIGSSTPLFLFNTKFGFPLSSLLVHKYHKAYDISEGSVFTFGAGGWSSILN